MGFIFGKRPTKNRTEGREEKSMLTGRERVLKAIRCEETDRAPWVPFVVCHGGALLGVSADVYLKSVDHLVAGAARAVELYQPDGLPVVFDLQVEAETFGCELVWAAENPPSVVSHPLAMGSGKTLADLKIPGPDDGRIGLSLEAARRMRQAHPDLAIYGLITGPFTLALHLLGTEIFMNMYEDPTGVHKLMDFCGQVAQAMAGYYVEAGCDVIGVVDPMTSQIGPDQFREFVTPYVAPVFEAARQRGALGSFFVCGHAQQNIQAMCECKPDNISVDENISLEYCREICLERGVSVGGNLQLTSVLLLGKPLDAQRNAIECLDIGGTRGFILAPGCDLPYATPPENLSAVARMVHDEYERGVVRALQTEQKQADLFDMADYGKTHKVIVDIITLDSEACAPCQYMVEAVRAVTPEFEGLVEWREHKIKQPESLVFMTSLMVKNIPTICIDGQITFVSRIPKKEELIGAIRRRIYEKLRMKIRYRHATLYVLGDGGEAFQEALSRTERAVAELGAEVQIEQVTKPAEILAYGVDPSQTPAVVLARYQVKAVRTPPETAIIKEWIKDALL